MSTLKNWLATYFAMSLLAASARADFASDFSPNRALYQISINGSSVAPRSAEADAGTYGERNTDVRGSFSVYKDVQLVEQKPVVTSFSVQPQIDRRDVLGLGSMNRSATFYTTGVAVSGFHLAPNGEMYFASLGLARAQESGQPESSIYLPTIYGMGTYHLTSATSLLYGAAFTSTFGIFIPLPALGLYSQLNPDWTFVTVLPILTALTYKASPQWSFSGVIRGEGYESGIANEGRFAGRDANLRLKSTAFHAGVGASWQAMPKMSLQGDAGVLAARKLKLSDSSGDFNEQKVGASPFEVHLGLTFRLDSPAGSGFARPTAGAEGNGSEARRPL